MTLRPENVDESTYMELRIQRLEQDRALRTSELLRVEEEVIELRKQLHKARTSMHYKDISIDRLNEELRQLQQGVRNEGMGNTEALQRAEQRKPDGVPGAGEET